MLNPEQTWKQFRWVTSDYKSSDFTEAIQDCTPEYYTGDLRVQYTGQIFLWRILWRYCYRKFHLVALGIYTDFGPVGVLVARPYIDAAHRTLLPWMMVSKSLTPLSQYQARASVLPSLPPASPSYPPPRSLPRPGVLSPTSAALAALPF